MSVRKTLIAVAAVTAALASTTVAVAPAAAQTIEVVQVAYGDLNLATASGRASLDGRIAYAARQLCGDYSHLELKFAAQSRDCQQSVIASAQEQIAAAPGERFASLRVSRAAS